MVYQSQTITATPEVTFPGTDATVTNRNANGFEIDYIDEKSEPCSIFIWGRSWGLALQDFEKRIDHSLICGHRAAKMNYDF